jgi:[CysO sulfur-carrier protein]-S-L-cysteine hydrolase
VLELTDDVYAAILGRCYDGLPLEACGLLAGHAVGVKATVFYPCENVARSSRIYTVDPKEHLRADRDAENRGLEIIGVVHSHTHTEAYPSPTDVAQAPDPGWHYVIVSLRHEAPVVRSYRIVDGEISEEPVGRLPR